MEFGLHLPHIGPMATRDGVLDMARAADAAGIDSLWASDHVIVPRDYASTYPYSPSGKMPIPEDAPFLEAVSTLLAVCGVTRRARLGTSVLVLPQRQPVLVAKQWATLDVLSGGRTIFGAGAGWLEEEFAALGVPFKGRGGRCDEALEILQRCWKESTVTFHGKHFQIDGIACEPKPIQQPRPPIWIGGHTPAAFRRVARYGDAWHGGGTVEVCRAARDAVRAEAEKIGRDPGMIELTIRDRGGLDVSTREARDQTIERLLPYAALGASHFLFLSFDTPEKVGETVRALQEEVKPALAAARPS
jgi:probable F420-dependent oxidoreductase